MMGSMMADLGGMRTTINNVRKKKGEDELSMDDLLIKLFDEVEYVWPRVGYPPLVTPFSQYVKNIALMNLLTIEQGKGRFVMMDEAMWGMILGKSGKIPGTIAPELVELAQKQGNFKSGQAKKNFLADLQKAKDAKMGSQLSAEQLAAFKHAKADAIVCPVKGQLFWEFQGDGEAAPAVEPFIGKEYKEGDAFCYIQAPWGEFVEVKADLGGKLVEINAKQGAKVRKGDVIAYIQRPEADA